jgi:ankyrin repeat protein
VNVRNTDGSTPLLLACDHALEDVVADLCALGADVNVNSRGLKGAASAPTDGAGAPTPLLVACRSGDAAIASLLLGAGADGDGGVSDASGDAVPLVWACFHDMADVAVALCKLRVDTTPTDAEGFTSLAWAADHGAAGVIRELLAAGAPVDTVCKGWTPLMLACVGRHTDAALALVQGGASVNAVAADGSGSTPLSLAREAGLADVVAALQAKGARA